MAWRIHCETPEGTPMVSSAMTREPALSFARDLDRRPGGWVVYFAMLPLVPARIGLGVSGIVLLS